jgi:hypothetical protein
LVVERTGLAVLGEEGDGKTWAVASWISAKLFANTFLPPVLWISREVVVADVEVLMASALCKDLAAILRAGGSGSSDGVSLRIQTIRRSYWFLMV